MDRLGQMGTALCQGTLSLQDLSSSIGTGWIPSCIKKLSSGCEAECPAEVPIALSIRGFLPDTWLWL